LETKPFTISRFTASGLIARVTGITEPDGNMAYAAPILSDVGLAIVELDLHPHRAAWLDPVSLFGPDQPRPAGPQNLVSPVRKQEPQLTLQNTDDAPRAGLGAMLPAERRRECRLIEYRSGAIRFHAASLIPLS
jgi:hypothetical protein